MVKHLRERKRIMKTKLYIIALLSVITVAANAQTFKNTYTPSANAQEYETFKSPQAMQTTAHEGTIYEPFSSTTPSDQSVVGEAQNSAGRPGQIRRGFDIGGDTPPGPSPIGDAMLPFALMALTFAGVVYFRKRKARA